MDEKKRDLHYMEINPGSYEEVIDTHCAGCKHRDLSFFREPCFNCLKVQITPTHYEKDEINA